VLGDPGYSPYNGTGIIQWQLNGGLNEQWQVDNLGNGRYAIVNSYSHLVLGDPGFSTTEGCGIIQWQWNNGQNEEWYITTDPALIDGGY
jgi:endoglucanase